MDQNTQEKSPLLSLLPAEIRGEIYSFRVPVYSSEFDLDSFCAYRSPPPHASKEQDSTSSSSRAQITDRFVRREDGGSGDIAATAEGEGVMETGGGGRPYQDWLADSWHQIDGYGDLIGATIPSKVV